MNKNAITTTEDVKISQLVENKDNPCYIKRRRLQTHFSNFNRGGL